MPSAGQRVRLLAGARLAWLLALLSLLAACDSSTASVPASPAAVASATAISAATAQGSLPGLTVSPVATAQPPAASATAPATPLPAATPPTQVTVQRQVTTGPGSFRFPDPSAGLAPLSGYRAALSVSFDGTRDGKPERTSKRYSLLASKNPSTRLLTIDLSENDAKATTVLMAESDGAAYERHGTSACVATVNAGAVPAGDRLEPASFLTGVLGASEATGGTVNTIESKHYTFDERAIGLAGVTHSSGELWIAVNGGYLVKYLLSSAGKADYFGAGMEGTLSLDYELTGANQPPSIQLPSDCPAGMLDAPLLPDATSVVKLPGTTTFETLADLAAVAAFYQQQLPALGWRAQGNPSVAGAARSMEYLRGQTHLLVNMYRTGDVTNVNIVADRTRR